MKSNAYRAKEMQEAAAIVQKFRRPAAHQGHVWLYLRTPPAAK